MRLIIAHSRLTSLGGGERATLELLRHLSLCFDTELWTSRYQPESSYPELETFPRRLLHAYEWLTIRPQADVVIAQNFGAYLLALRHRRTLIYAHTLRSKYLAGGRRPDLLARRYLDRAAIDYAARLYTNSEYSAAKVRALYDREASILSPGVEQHYFEIAASVGAFALYVGRLAPEKGLERLLSWSANLPVDLVVAGDGDPGYIARLKAIAPPGTLFTGPVLGSALERLYADCRYLVFLPYGEEFGLAALEAMAAGKPVVAAREGALPELVTHGETGFLVDDAEDLRAASLQLLQDDALCRKLGSRGREVARAYTWRRFAEGIEEACREIFAAPAGSDPVDTGHHWRRNDIVEHVEGNCSG
jgi:glycosyltransferase involved in cell wall biosynthesis